ncbi:hypothetical protein F3Y22_tig00111402pilonHSYRG00293 [Hibiscus syriacus]|uniref:RNase H type-1 domain-containing protein n=1 Tax=Hibiscus syriacus TaxID=106335 RepID=A0A6A2XTI4_HIBSY|nr:hypothetical protein F3Y22_tig00111402pilonHSYRG00293 [Hibiscus syriacus]
MSCSGFIVRDDRGLILAAGHRTTLHITSTFMAEALAVIHGLQLILDLGIRSVVVESNSRTIISKLNTEEIDPSVIRSMIGDAKFLANHLESCSFTFINDKEIKHHMQWLQRDLEVPMTAFGKKTHRRWPLELQMLIVA